MRSIPYVVATYMIKAGNGTILSAVASVLMPVINRSYFLVIIDKNRHYVWRERMTCIVPPWQTVGLGNGRVLLSSSAVIITTSYTSGQYRSGQYPVSIDRKSPPIGPDARAAVHESQRQHQHDSCNKYRRNDDEKRRDCV